MRHQLSGNSNTLAWAFACIAALGLSGCTATGFEIPEPGLRRPLIVFDWHGGEDLSGTMAAGLADGRQFHGDYFQVTRDLSPERLTALRDGWSDENLGWRHWRAAPAADFLRHYDGKIVANLHGSGGERMRCRFRLIRPSAGMRGGGEGLCQLTDGTAFDATFPAVRSNTRAVRGTNYQVRRRGTHQEETDHEVA